MVSIVHAARDIGRLRDISTVLVRHGFGEVVRRVGLGRPRKAKDSQPPSQRSNGNGLDVAADEEKHGDRERREMSTAVRVRRVLEDLGPSFVKLGQIASTRPDVLPADVIAELKKLQDSVAPVPFEEIKEQVERSLGVELADLFEDFDTTPLAAASIAQVHRARLKSDEGTLDVVVKVQRPGIAETIAIDFTAEAENALRFSQNFAGYSNVKFPDVHRQASSKHVITLEYLDGGKIDEARALGYSGKRLARISLDVLVKQIFEDGFFHADPHPGNVLVLGPTDNPVIAMIDLGMVGRLSPRLRDLTIDVMVGAVRRDYEAIADALYAIGTPTKKIDMQAYRAEVALLAEKYLGKQLKDIELSSLIRDLVRGATKYGVQIPTDFTLMGKALMTIESVGKEIDPDLDVFAEARPLFVELLRKRYSPERLGNELLRRIERLSGATYNMPQQIQEVLDDLRLGRLSVRAVDPEAAKSTELLGRRLHSAIVAAAFTLSGAWLIAARQELYGVLLIGFAIAVLFAHAIANAYRDLRRKR
jgi:ubiquinone biosynthesis protein